MVVEKDAVEIASKRGEQTKVQSLIEYFLLYIKTLCTIMMPLVGDIAVETN